MDLRGRLNKSPFTFFLVKFVALYALLYFFNVAFIGITSPSNYYNSFLDRHLDYIDLLRGAVLQVSRLLTSLSGFNTRIEEPYLLRIEAGPGVKMVYSCIGYGIMSLWTAFVIAYDGRVKRKILWALMGCFCIFLINCLRVSVLLIALAKKWNVNEYLDHHTMFNIVSYILIFLMMYLYTNRTTSIEHSPGLDSRRDSP
jgi:exosortase/archaeosortase family protein